VIGRGEYLRVELGGSKVGLERDASGGGGAILRDAGGGHARELVDAQRVGNAGDAGRR
jgi:hypothetical protein